MSEIGYSVMVEHSEVPLASEMGRSIIVVQPLWQAALNRNSYCGQLWTAGPVIVHCLWPLCHLSAHNHP